MNHKKNNVPYLYIKSHKPIIKKLTHKYLITIFKIFNIMDLLEKVMLIQNSTVCNEVAVLINNNQEN